MTPPSNLFQIENCPLPEIALLSEAPKALAVEHERIAEALSANDAARDKCKAQTADMFADLAKAFDLKKVNTLKECRGQMMQIAQKEVDILGRFDGWRRSYSAALLELHAAAVKDADQARQTVRTGILSNGGFDDEAKGQVQAAEGIVSVHPDVRAQTRRVERYADTAARAAGMGGHLMRSRELAGIIVGQLKEILESEGLEPVAKYCYQNGCDCQSLLDARDH